MLFIGINIIDGENDRNNRVDKRECQVHFNSFHIIFSIIHNYISKVLPAFKRMPWIKNNGRQLFFHV